MRLFYFLLLVLMGNSLQAQTLQGIVTDKSTGKPVFPATVVNVRTQQTSLTDASGFYTIPAMQGDIIAFTCIGYKSVEKVKPPSVIVATLNVSLEHTEYELDEVTLRPGALTKYQMDSIERRQTYKTPLSRRPPSPIMSPVSALAEKFSKKAQRTYQFQEDYEVAEAQKFIDTRYNPTTVNAVTGLTGDSIAHFMYAYPMPYDFARTASALEIKMWVRENYKQWMRRPENNKN
jgi:hypothetical protein